MGDYGKLVESISGLLRDLVGLVAEFSVPLEHEWAPLPVALRRLSCDCMKTASRTAVSCSCRAWKYQHFCSIYTMQQCGTLEFDLQVQQRPAQRWWTGILWCSTHDGFQDPRTFTSDTAHIDSLSDLGELYSSVLDSSGLVENIAKKSEGLVEYQGPALFVDDFRLLSSTTIRIRLVTLEDTFAVEFIINGYPTKTLYVGRATVSGLVARPFVQFEHQESRFPTLTSSITIDTPLF